jgi:NitT/TauT family transport system ATP-binding protein
MLSTPAPIADAAPLVTLGGVAKRFASGTLALDRLDLTIRAGEFISLLGPSGCGKSTALRLIAGLSEPSGGRILWGGAESASNISSGRQAEHSARAHRRRRPGIGFVFQEPTLMPWATVLRNVMLPLELDGGDRRRAAARAAAALERVGLAAFRDSYPRELSGGMRMRVSIARALVTDPPLLLMDEPFAALDEITRFRLNDDLLGLWRAIGNTVVFVTHSVFESVYLSNRIVVMTPRPGRVYADLAIDAPYPRDESFRTSAEYAGLCRVTSQALSRAMDGAAWKERTN